MNSFAVIAGFLSAVFVPLTAWAGPVMPVECVGLIGCPKPPDINVIAGLFPRVAAFLIMIAAGASVIFIVISGVEMVAYSEEGGVKGKSRLLYALGGLGLCLMAATIVLAVSTEVPTGSTDLVIALMSTTVRVILTFFNVIFAISIIYAGYDIMLGFGKSDKYEAGLKRLKWSIAGAIMVNSARAIVQAFLNLEL
jgi:hypothetical protein